MNTTYRIRLARAEDIETIVALEREIETLPHWRVSDYLAALSSGHSKPGIQGTSRCMFVAVSVAGASVVGFAVGKTSGIEAETLAELESVGVAERARRSGVGRALCEAVIAWSREMGAAELELEVRSRSTGPIALYEGLGFVVEGMRAGYYGDPVDDAVLMRCYLAIDSAQGMSQRGDL